MRQSSNKKHLLRLMFITLSFYMLGLLLAFWYGIGWFLLLHTIRGLFTSIPQIYLPTVRAIVGNDATKELEEHILSKSQGHFFVSPSSIWMNLFNTVLTIITFWKANISIAELLSL